MVLFNQLVHIKCWQLLLDHIQLDKYVGTNDNCAPMAIKLHVVLSCNKVLLVY